MSDSNAKSVDRDSNVPSKTPKLVTNDNYLHINKTQFVTLSIQN